MNEVRNQFMTLPLSVRKMTALNDICRIERNGGISKASDLDFNIYIVAKEILLSE